MRSLRGHATAVGLIALLVARDAFTEERKEPVRQYLPGQVLVLVPPKYPETALAKGETAQVDVLGTVKVDGSLELGSISVTPPNGDFESAVREVSRIWLLHPGLKDCQFVEIPGQVTFWFEIEGGKPKISYGALQPSAEEVAKFRQLVERSGSRKRIEGRPPEYPADVSRNRDAADDIFQFAYMRVDADGSVTSVEVMPLRGAHAFAPSMKKALGRWRFEAQPKPWCATLELTYKLR